MPDERAYCLLHTRPLAECPRECLVRQQRGVVYYAAPGATKFHIYCDDGFRPPAVWCRGGRDIPVDATKRFSVHAQMTGRLTEGQTCCEGCALAYAQALVTDADPEVLEHLAAAVRAREQETGKKEPRCIHHSRLLAVCPRECMLRQLRGVIYAIGVEGGTERHLIKNDGYLPDATWCGYPEMPDMPEHSGRLQPAQMFIGTLPEGLTCCVTCAARYREALGPDARQPLPPHQLTEQLARHHAPPPVPDDVRERYTVNCAACAAPFPIRSSVSMRSGNNSGCGSCPTCRVFQHFILTPEGGVDAVTWDAYMASRPTPGLADEVRDIADKFGPAFEQMRREGD